MNKFYLYSQRDSVLEDIEEQMHKLKTEHQRQTEDYKTQMESLRKRKESRMQGLGKNK